jgi:hypothetical protein
LVTIDLDFSPVGVFRSLMKGFACQGETMGALHRAVEHGVGNGDVTDPGVPV